VTAVLKAMLHSMWHSKENGVQCSPATRIISRAGIVQDYGYIALFPILPTKTEQNNELRNRASLSRAGIDGVVRHQQSDRYTRHHCRLARLRRVRVILGGL
jgi:hypothetical protein